MKEVKVKTYLTDLLECDVCGSDYTYNHIFLICKWDTEHNEYYLSQILCRSHVEVTSEDN